MPITSQLPWQVNVKAATPLKRKASFCFTTHTNNFCPAESPKATGESKVHHYNEES